MTQSRLQSGSWALIAALVLSSLAAGIVPARASESGSLIKCEESSSVYYLADDGKRHPFPNERIFHSWYEDFDNLQEVSCEELGSLPLGSSVTYQSGTRLIKLPSAPVVYFPEADGVLRPIQSEDQARELFGDDWALRVDDLSEAFFPHYEVGAALEDGEIPNGLLLEDDLGSIFRVENSDAVEIEDLIETHDLSALPEFTVDFEEFEDRLERKLTRVSEDIAAEILDEIWDDIERELKETYHYDDDEELAEDEAEDEHEDRLDDEEETEIEEALDALNDAEEEIRKAENDIADRAEQGNDVTDAETLLEEARQTYNDAVAFYESGDYAQAEQDAEEARDLANESREGHDSDASDDTQDDDSEDTTEDGDDDSSEDAPEDEDDGEATDDGDDDSSGEPEEVHLDMSAGNFFFSPSTVTVASGAELRIEFSDVEGTHTFALDELGIEETIETGEDVEFLVDLAPGTYTFYCSVGDHRSLGMEGTLIVE